MSEIANYAVGEVLDVGSMDLIPSSSSTLYI